MTSAGPLGRVVAGYRIVGRLRRGPDATVYHAVREKDGAEVAVKVLRTEANLDGELANVERLPAHPNIVRIVDVGRAVDGRPFLAMDYHPDGSYADLLANAGVVPVDEVVRVGIAVAEALQATHDIGLVHRDVTPGNILRGPDGPLLTDFGIAAMPAELAGTVALDRLTPPHASPEALLRQPQGPASDIYSLGSTLWTLLVGHGPFAEPDDRSPDPFAYRERALHEPVPPVPVADVPLWLQAALRRAMAKNPAERYATAGAFATALRERNEPWPAGVPLPGEQPSAPVTSTAPAESSAPSSEPVLPAPASSPPSEAHPIASDRQSAESPAPPPSMPPVPELAASSSLVPAGDRRWLVPEPTPAPVVTADPAWWEPAGETPTMPPPDYETETARPGGSRLRVVTVIAVVLLLVGGLGAYLLARQPSTAQNTAGQPTTGAPPQATVSASVAPGIAPQSLKLDDERVAVTLSWSDPTGGQAVFYVIGTPAGGAPTALANAERGKTSVRVNGLNPTVEYCFVLVAALSVDQVGNSEPICTRRFATPKPSSK